jgi:tRNA threonylcarbamoyladenosine biosynthesis protein TsaE
MESIYKLVDIDAAAEEFINWLKTFTVIAFHGNMGAGKTTFIKAVCRQLGVKENISSPTFSIINQYKIKGNKNIFHIDLYRLKNMEEAVNAGVEECIYSEDFCFIEWPEKISSILPAETVNVFIEPLDESTRKLNIKLPKSNSL